MDEGDGRRADRDRRARDAAPDLLDKLVRDALKPFYDTSLERRVRDARREWEQHAQKILDANIDQPRLEKLRADAEVKLRTLRAELDAINDALRVEAIEGIELPEAVIPEPWINAEPNGLPLVDSDWPFGEQARRLIDHKAYVNGIGS